MSSNQNTPPLVYEAHRSAAVRELAVEILGFVRHASLEGFPLPVLKPLAGITFSDGAAFLVPQENGSLSITSQISAITKHSIESTGRSSPFWKSCQEHRPVIYSGMTEDQSADQGLRIPGGGAILIAPATSPISMGDGVSICVWRSKAVGSELSSAPYQVWDAEAFVRCIHQVYLTLEASKSAELRARTDAIRESVTALLNVFQPRLLVLFKLAETVELAGQYPLLEELSILRNDILDVQRLLASKI